MLGTEGHQRNLMLPMPVGFAILLFIPGTADRTEFQTMFSSRRLNLDARQATAPASKEIVEY